MREKFKLLPGQSENSLNEQCLAIRRLSRGVKIVAWGNILLQLLLPITLSAGPALAASASSNAKSSLLTQRYTLAAGEDVAMVAEKYGISLDELKKLNQFRTFPKAFSVLSAGDELEVPAQASPFSVDLAPSGDHAATVAAAATSAATVLTSEDPVKSTAQLARSTLNSELNQSAQQWLSQFGSARVGLNINDDFKLDGSELDVLFALYDTPNNLLFTQLGGRNKESRNTLNAGVGWRSFQDTWMFGVNTFFDNDLTGKNRRIGIGAEIGADYLKLAANGYFSLTDWHQSHDFADYNERPANGYDLRLDAYLPVYPQLGGKLSYERYRGDEVALFGSNNRQKDPYAVTAGLNYTPFPLLTLGAEHRAGKGGESDSRLNLQLNYRLGGTWKSHIDPAAVASTRTLAGGRYDLVSRNYNIVLDYQKQQLVQLRLPEQVSQEEGISLTLTAEVISKYAFDRIEWDGEEIIAAGGKLTPVSDHSVVIIMPSYQADAARNLYHIYAVAHDQRGNVSARSRVQVNVIANQHTIAPENIEIKRNNAVADGEQTNEIVFRAVDNNNIPLQGRELTFSADNGAQVLTRIAVTDENGLASVQVTNTRSGTTHVSVTMKMSGNTQQVPVNFIVGKPAMTHSSIAIDGASYVASSAVIVDVTLQDKMGNKVEDQADQLSNWVVVPNTELSTAWKHLGAGRYQAEYISVITGSGLTATLKYQQWSSELSSGAYEITANAADYANSSLRITNSDLDLRAGDEVIVQVTLRDANGNGIPGYHSVLESSVDIVAPVNPTAWRYLNDGIYELSYTVGKATINAVTHSVSLYLQHWEEEQIHRSDAYTIKPGPASAQYSSLEHTKSVYDFGEYLYVSVMLMDAYQNPVLGQQANVTVTMPGTELRETFSPDPSRGDGWYKAKYVALLAGYDYIPTLNFTDAGSGVQWNKHSELRYQVHGREYTILRLRIDDSLSYLVNDGMTPDQKFPQSLFPGARFSVGLAIESESLQYEWSVESDSIDVEMLPNNVFHVKPSMKNLISPNLKNGKVTLNGKRINGEFDIKYTFYVKKWFYMPYSGKSNGTEATQACSGFNNFARVPRLEEITGSKIHGFIPDKVLGALKSEWRGNYRDMPNYADVLTISSSSMWWTVDKSAQYAIGVNLYNGDVTDAFDPRWHVICVKSL
ncbi:inverse autotransporter beta domain-containing protein [Serratia microhaemolytica]|uniref:inverse autotransporter beta domain-containing protein n=1 Tax=Serratia microhaemolytica TaxID=2675110 RepID=UPI000FDDAC4E|nr:inverse autotransporter beta domain-containing protein [Serratia microhaemolytica]